MESNEANFETNHLLRGLYFRLRSAEDNRTVARDLESDLSRFILEAEELMLASKNDTARKAIYSRRRARLKRIADGLAWSVLDFDEIRLLSYAGNPTPGLMAGKGGYYAERFVVDTLYESPEVVFAIQNDITNILRVGDVTVLLPNQTIRVVEVKSGSQKVGLARAQRQKERASNIHDYLRSGDSTILAEGDIGRLLHREALWQSAYYWGRVERVCNEARKLGVIWKRLDASSLVVAYRPHLLANLQDIIGVAVASMGWVNAKLRVGVLSRHFEEKEKTSAAVRYIMPVTAFRIDPEVVASLLVGDLDVIVIVNETAVVEALREAGMVVTDEDGCVTIETETASVQISERSWNWVVYGLRTVSTLIQSVQCVLSDPALTESCGLTEDPATDR